MTLKSSWLQRAAIVLKHVRDLNFNLCNVSFCYYKYKNTLPDHLTVNKMVRHGYKNSSLNKEINDEKTFSREHSKLNQLIFKCVLFTILLNDISAKQIK